MVSSINKQLLLTAYAYLFIMEQQKDQQGSEAMQVEQKDRQPFVDFRDSGSGKKLRDFAVEMGIADSQTKLDADWYDNNKVAVDACIAFSTFVANARASGTMDPDAVKDAMIQTVGGYCPWSNLLREQFKKCKGDKDDLLNTAFRELGDQRTGGSADNWETLLRNVVGDQVAAIFKSGESEETRNEKLRGAEESYEKNPALLKIFREAWMRAIVTPIFGSNVWKIDVEQLKDALDEARKKLPDLEVLLSVFNATVAQAQVCAMWKRDEDFQGKIAPLIPARRVGGVDVPAVRVGDSHLRHEDVQKAMETGGNRDRIIEILAAAQKQFEDLTNDFNRMLKFDRFPPSYRSERQDKWDHFNGGPKLEIMMRKQRIKSVEDFALDIIFLGDREKRDEAIGALMESNRGRVDSIRERVAAEKERAATLEELGIRLERLDRDHPHLVVRNPWELIQSAERHTDLGTRFRMAKVHLQDAIRDVEKQKEAEAKRIIAEAKQREEEANQKKAEAKQEEEGAKPTKERAMQKDEEAKQKNGKRADHGKIKVVKNKDGCGGCPLQ